MCGWRVQVVPHITTAIGDWIEDVACRPVKSGTNPEDEGHEADVCVIELGAHPARTQSLSATATTTVSLDARSPKQNPQSRRWGRVILRMDAGEGAPC